MNSIKYPLHTQNYVLHQIQKFFIIHIIFTDLHGNENPTFDAANTTHHPQTSKLLLQNPGNIAMKIK